jgi:ABC-type lipoprotein release transport system permease subunit
MSGIPWTGRLPYPLRDAVRRWRSMLGMMLGVGIALGLGMALLAVSAASVDLYSADFRKSGADLYMVQQGGKLIAVLPGDTPGEIKDARHVLAQIRGLPGVTTVLGLLTSPLEREPESRRSRDEPAELLTTVGVDGDPTAISNALVMESGRWLRRSGEIVVGTKFSRDKKVATGDTLRLSGRDFDVVGVGKLRGAGLNADSVVYMDLQALRQRGAKRDAVNLIIVDATGAEAIRQRIQELGSLAVSDPQDLVRQAEAVNQSAVAIRWIFVVLTLGIAGLFVSNMLGRSVSERRLEFATLRAIGVPARTVLLNVAMQAGLVTIAASFVGIGVSTVLGTFIDFVIASSYGLESLYAPDAGLFLLVFVLAAALGVVSGLMPARRAARVDPVLVLREA